jgi:hypothetical protein
VSDSDRTVVALLCLLAVVVVAAQFPAAGLGAAPDGGGPIGEPPTRGAATPNADSDEPSGGTDDGEPSTTTSDTPEPSTDDTTTATTTTSETTTSETTIRETTTAVPSATETAGDGGPVGSILVGILVLVGGGVVAVVALSGYSGGTRGSSSRGSSDLAALEGVGSILERYLPRIGSGVAGAVFALPNRTMRFVVASSKSAPRLLTALGSTAAEVGDGLAFATRGIGKGLGRAIAAAPGGFAAGIGALGGSIFSGLASAPSGLGSLLSGVRGGDSTVRGTDRPDADVRDATSVEPESPEVPPPASVEEAWERMIEAGSPSGWRTKSPVEVARRVVRAGYPPEPVATLTRLFRRVRYGADGTNDERLGRAREALARIEGETEEGDRP